MRQGTAYTYSPQVHPAYIRRAELLGTGVDDKKKKVKKKCPQSSLSLTHLWKCTLVRTLAFRLPLPLRTFFAASLAFEATKNRERQQQNRKRRKRQHWTHTKGGGGREIKYTKPLPTKEYTASPRLGGGGRSLSTPWYSSTTCAVRSVSSCTPRTTDSPLPGTNHRHARNATTAATTRLQRTGAKQVLPTQQKNRQFRLQERPASTPTPASSAFRIDPLLPPSPPPDHYKTNLFLWRGCQYQRRQSERQ